MKERCLNWLVSEAEGVAVKKRWSGSVVTLVHLIPPDGTAPGVTGEFTLTARRSDCGFGHCEDQHENNRMEIETQADTAAVLVVSEINYRMDRER
jgi:hypothetical protein